MAISSPPIVGGRIYVAWNDKRFECSGNVRLALTDQSREALATNSGKMVGTIRAELPTWEMDFWDIVGADPMELWNEATGVNLVVIAQDTGKRYHWTDAMIHGKPELDATEGRISGMRCSTDQFQMTRE